MSDEIEKFFDVEEEELNSRILFIVNLLEKYIEETRSKIPEDLDGDILFENKDFVNWNIANLILLNSKKDINNSAFNRLVYFMFEQTGGNIDDLIAQYNIQPKYDNGILVGYSLIILEEQTG